jgi:MATE family multidrug resistance protein
MSSQQATMSSPAEPIATDPGDAAADDEIPHRGAAGLKREARATLHLALPITFAQIALMTMGLVDAALVGRVSQSELAAVSIGNALVFAMVCPAMGVTLAVEPLASQAVGAGDLDRAWRAVRAAAAAVLLLSLPTMALAAMMTFLLAPAGVDPAVAASAERFVLARLPGIPGFLLFIAVKAYLEARGMTRPLFIIGWAANVVNLVVASLLVFGDRALERIGLPGIGLPALGALGAGIATSVASTLLAVLTLYTAWRARPSGSSLLRGEHAEVRASARTLARVGVPIGMQLLTEVGVFAAVTVIMGRLGATATAAHQIAIGLASFTFMAVIGMANATAVRVGRAIGAREVHGPRRAGVVGMGLGAMYMVVCALLFLLFPRQLAALFTEDAAVLDAAVPLMRIAAIFQIADGVQGVASGALRGAADTRFASLANVVCHWCIGLPIALFLGFSMKMGAPGLWWGLCAGLFAAAVMLVTRFLRLSSRTIAAVSH